MNAAIREVVHPFDREGDSPNKLIDDVIQEQLQKAKDGKLPPDMVTKVLTQAIAWEKVKHHIKDDGEEFDPDKPDGRA